MRRRRSPLPLLAASSSLSDASNRKYRDADGVVMATVSAAAVIRRRCEICAARCAKVTFACLRVNETSRYHRRWAIPLLATAHFRPRLGTACRPASTSLTVFRRHLKTELFLRCFGSDCAWRLFCYLVQGVVIQLYRKVGFFLLSQCGSYQNSGCEFSEPQWA